MELRNAGALVTGASYGIGADLARVLAARGARVVLVARSEDRLRQLAAELGGDAIVADLASPADVDGLVERAEAASGGPIDVLVNNASTCEIGPFAMRDPATISEEVQVDLTAVMQLTCQALPGMIERDRGHLVFMSSLQAAASIPGFAVYAAAKAAISHFAAILRIELAGTAIGTTVVAPGPVDTSLWGRVEASDYTSGVLRRFAKVRLLTKDDPATIAESIVEAVLRNRRHVRTPRRAVALDLLSEAPRRITELLLTGAEPERPAADRSSRRGS